MNIYLKPLAGRQDMDDAKKLLQIINYCYSAVIYINYVRTTD